VDSGFGDRVLTDFVDAKESLPREPKSDLIPEFKEWVINWRLMILWSDVTIEETQRDWIN